MTNQSNKSSNTTKTTIQTGPKTESGKQVSSKNAIKGGIFAKGYLSNEDAQALDTQLSQLNKQWNANDPTRQILVQCIHQTAISANRLALAQQQKIDAAMQSSNIRKQFAEFAGHSLITCEYLPAWFFQEPDHPEKTKAVYLDAVWLEAAALKQHYSDQLVAQVETRFPNLFRYIMNGQRPGASFIAVLGQRYKQSVPTLNLGVLQNDIKETYPQHLIWAQDPQRYEIFIQGIRANQVIEGMDYEKSIRYATTFQNLIHKSISALTAMEQFDWQRQQQQWAQESIPVNSVLLGSPPKPEANATGNTSACETLAQIDITSASLANANNQSQTSNILSH